MKNFESLLLADIKNALKSGDKHRLETLRLLLDVVKKERIDSGKEITEPGFITIVEKMIKQRHDSIAHYEKGGRQDLATHEKEEIHFLTPFLPERLSADETADIIDKAIADTKVTGIRDMGKVMAALKPLLAGRADMSQVSASVKEKLSG